MKDIKTVSPEPGRSNEEAAYSALKEGAAVVDLHKSILRLTGKDPLGMLNAVLTNEVPAEGGGGAYAFLLNPKGRIQTDLRALKSGDDILIVTEPEGADAAREILGRYAPFSRVKLEDISSSWSILGLYGPTAREALSVLSLTEHETFGIELGGETLLAAGVARPVEGYDLIGPSGSLLAAREILLESGAVSADLTAYERVRVELGVPRFGADISPDNFPGETGALERAVDFQKGCYPGQETVARMHYRGHPNKTLHRLTFEGAPPVPGAEITQNGRQVGVVTSVAPTRPGGPVPALGYLSRNADPNAPLEAGGSTLASLVPADTRTSY